MNGIWSGIMILSLGFACFSGTMENMLPAALSGAGEGVSLAITLAAGYAFFCGLIEIAKAAGLPAALSRALRPLLSLLFPNVHQKETQEAMTMNLSSNMLGIGNAATPMGLEAMRLMRSEEEKNPLIGRDMNMFLIVNATSIQLFPTTLLTLRIAANSQDAASILLPTLVCTLASTVTAVLCAKACERLSHDKA